MDISTLINAVTGQFGALCLSIFFLYNLMSYHKELLQKLYQDNREDRELYRNTLLGLSTKIDKIGEDIKEIKAKSS